MTSPEADRRLEDVIKWSARIAGYVEGKSFDDFNAESIMRDAVERCLEVVGEAAHHAALADPSLAEGEAGPEIAKAYRMRNVIAHGYQIIEPRTIWDTATLSIPQFVDIVRGVRKEFRLGESTAVGARIGDENLELGLSVRVPRVLHRPAPDMNEWNMDNISARHGRRCNP